MAVEQPREEVDRLVERILDAQRAVTSIVAGGVRYEDLDKPTEHEGIAVQDVLRMWVWHFWSHHRELVRARGALTGDNPHFHVPHFIRQASEECGRLVGELACLTDDQLDLQIPDGGRTIREIVEHVIDSLEAYFPQQLADSP